VLALLPFSRSTFRASAPQQQGGTECELPGATGPRVECHSRRDASTAKQQRLRQAQDEAAAEVAAYRASREDAYRKLVAGVRREHCASPLPLPEARSARFAHCFAHSAFAAQHSGDAGATSNKLEQEGNKSIAEQAAAVKSHGEGVVAYLVGLTTRL
jgi:hypothetical protein